MAKLAIATAFLFYDNIFGLSSLAIIVTAYLTPWFTDQVVKFDQRRKAKKAQKA